MKKEQFLYEKIYFDLKEKILAGELKEGSRLPQTGEMAKGYGVSTITITNALNALKAEGYLDRIKGKGSFIRLPAGAAPEGVEEAPMDQYRENGEARTLGLVLEHVSSCFGLDMMYAMDKLSAEAGYKLCVRFSYGMRERETEEIGFLKALGVGGIIVMPCHGLYYNQEILKLVIEGFPLVLIDKKMEGIPIPSVRTDNYLAMKELVDYLVGKGKKRIGYITFSENGTSSIKDRRKGFQNAIKEAGCESLTECCLEEAANINIYSDDSPEYKGAVEKYLHDQQDMDAVICAEYGIARCLEDGRGIGGRRNIVVCCIDEDYLSPGGFHFTHIRQDEKKIAAEAIRILLKQVEKDLAYQQMDCLVPGILREA